MATKNEENQEKTNSRLFKVVNFERVSAGFRTQKSLSKAMEKHTQSFWSGIRSGSTKHKDVIALCETLDLQVVIRNKKTNTEHILTEEK